MRETRLSGSEGGAGQPNVPSLPLSATDNSEMRPVAAISIRWRHRRVRGLIGVDLKTAARGSSDR